MNIAEELAADDNDPEAVAIYIERLYDLAENPVNVNSADENEVSRLFFLSDFQIKVLTDYVHSSGKIISVFELANLPGFDKETAEMMIRFISLDAKMKLNQDSVRLRSASLTNISIKPGNSDSTSLGSAWKILSKYKFTAGRLSGGFTIEKDPGEKFLTGKSPQPDFLSFNLAFRGSGTMRKFIVGDYSARFGQGTNINTGIRSGLSLTSPGYMSSKDEIKPYTSTDENNFFRGVAAEFDFRNLGLSLFYSNNYSDATLVSSGYSENYIENFYKAGIHSTSSQLLKKDAISDITCGLNLSYNFNNLRIGLTWSEDKFSLPVYSVENDPENIFDFKGYRNNLYSVYYNSFIKRILLYGEFSTNEYRKYSFVQGLSFRPSDRLTINFLFRDYSAGYMSFHGKGPGSSSSTSNEQGILANFTFEAAKHLFISGGCDNQYFPWLKYRCSIPSWGRKKELRVKFLPTDNLTIDASYSYSYSMVDSSQNRGIPQQKQVVTRSIKGTVRYALYDNLILGTRVDYKVAGPAVSKGTLLLQDINYRFRYIPVTLWFRYCLFSTDDWDSRIYTYENDLLYSFSVPALSGEGTRTYLMAKWEIKDIAELRVKYSTTSLIKGNSNSADTDEIKIQFRVIF
ncbi:MAG: helix-hairpin-helix domain-containing protein [Bacteroidales bacterium]|nr:helix-hairpin-helix domain-containing protein [Bacteroidales bacterium]